MSPRGGPVHVARIDRGDRSGHLLPQSGHYCENAHGEEEEGGLWEGEGGVES